MSMNQDSNQFITTVRQTEIKISDISVFAKETLSFLRDVKLKEVEGATTVALSGNLGAGKTTFTKAFAQEIGITETITSPTFVIAKFYELKNKPWKKFIHIDAYRLESGDELSKLGFDELFKDPENLIFIEWPENVKSILPEKLTTISFEVIDEETRKASVSLCA